MHGRGKTAYAFLRKSCFILVLMANSTITTSTTTTSGASTTSSTSATTSTITTTTLPPQFCLAEKIYGEHAEETALLRLVRDELLSTTPEGRELIRLYYQWNAILARVPGENGAIREDIKELIDEILPVFEEMVE